MPLINAPVTLSLNKYFFYIHIGVVKMKVVAIFLSAQQLLRILFSNGATTVCVGSDTLQYAVKWKGLINDVGRIINTAGGA